MNVVISQSMLFPWVGMLEQMRLADVFVHYDDVQFSKGSFTNRVQLKTARGLRWMTVPLKSHRLGQTIGEVAFKEKSLWVDEHMDLIEKSLAGAPFLNDALKIAGSVYQQNFESIGMLARQSMLAIAQYYNLLSETRIIDVAELKIPGTSSERVRDIVLAVGGNAYITGHGAKNYLDHRLFDDLGIVVRYMDYVKKHYPQLHGDFTPYVSGLDLIANCGPNGINCICSPSIPWKEFIHASN
jgi:hypothetical protein